MNPSLGSPFRPDIQGLRALAVGLVLVFHIWPAWLPGGYVGVDVFFVISGYLITSMLKRELDRTGAISLRDFYARRIRRLLPAASLTLLATALATLLLAPQYKWMEIAQDIAASALYVQNWRLAASAVDYLAAEEAVGPLKHFWSLAIEEQFYIVWPLLMLALFASIARRTTRTGTWTSLAAFAAAAGLVSLGFSMQLTADAPGIAYFASHARAWELALGACLALAPWTWQPRWARLLAAWAGLGMVLAAGLLFSKETAFPGHAALLPTLGTALVLWSGAGAEATAAQRLLAWRPMQFFGDISYSLYLWHWPLVVFTGYALGRSHAVHEGWLLLAGSVLMAWGSTRYVENRFRAHAGHGDGARWSFRAPAIAGVGTGLCLVAALAIGAWVDSRARQSLALEGQHDYPGSLVMTSNATAPSGLAFIPSLAAARQDLASSYGNGCHQRPRHLVPKGCELGDPNADYLVVLVGDSHAANWIPAFEQIGKDAGVRILGYTKSACSLTLRDITLDGKPYTECTRWSRAFLGQMRTLQPDMLVIARSRGPRLYGTKSRSESNRQAEEMYVGLLAELQGFIPRLVVLRDTPRMSVDPPECLAQEQDCSTPRKKALAGTDPLFAAAGRHAGVLRVDLGDAFCDSRRCEPVIGNVLVWRDKHHFTATYSRTLSDELAGRLGLATTERASAGKAAEAR